LFPKTPKTKNPKRKKKKKKKKTSTLDSKLTVLPIQLSQILETSHQSTNSESLSLSNNPTHQNRNFFFSPKKKIQALL
jgi:hypothetical protein